MRKTIMLGILIALSGATTLAQARDVTAPEQSSAVEASQPDMSAVRGDQSMRERGSASREHRRENRDGRRAHHHEGRERHGENGRKGQHH